MPSNSDIANRRKYTAAQEADEQKKIQQDVARIKEQQRQREIERIKNLPRQDISKAPKTEQQVINQINTRNFKNYNLDSSYKKKPSYTPEELQKMSILYTGKESTPKERASVVAEQLDIRRTFPSQTRFIPETQRITVERQPKKEYKPIGYTAFKPEKGQEGIYQREKQAGTAQIEAMRSKEGRLGSGGLGGLSVSPLEFGYNILAEGERVKAEPVRTALVAGGFALGTAIGGAGLGIESSTLAGGIGLGMTAIGVQQEVKEGKTGAGALGSSAFYFGTGTLLGKAGEKLINTKLTYDIKPNVQGEMGSGYGILGGKKAGSVFINTEEVLLSVTRFEPTKFKAFGKEFQLGGRTVESMSKGTLEGTKTFSNKGKLISEGFNYLEPTNFKTQVSSPQLKTREISFLDQPVNEPRSSKVGFKEVYMTEIGGTGINKDIRTNLDLNVKDVFNRKAAATPEFTQVTEITGVAISKKGALSLGAREVSFKNVEFDFSKNIEFGKDQIILDKGKVTKITAPRYMEQSTQVKSGRGTLTIEKTTSIDINKLLSSKRASTGGQKLELLQETKQVSIQMPELEQGRNLNLGERVGQQAFSTSQSSFQNVGLISLSQQKAGQTIKQTPGLSFNIKQNLFNQNIKEAIIPQSTQSVIQSVKQDISQNTAFSVKQSTIQATKQDIMQDIGFKTDNSFNIRQNKEVTPPPETPTPFSFPKLKGLYFPNQETKAKKIKFRGKKQYNPSVEAIVFNIRGEKGLKASATGIGLRPIASSNSKIANTISRRTINF